MFLVFPRAMLIPEMSGRLEDANFDDWLTAALIENANQPAFADHRRNQVGHVGRFGFTDLLMLEIAQRKGKIWIGNFHVEFSEEDSGPAPQRPRSGVLGFALDTETGKITFDSQPKSLSENRYINESASWRGAGYAENIRARDHWRLCACCRLPHLSRQPGR
jgi:hypothetical protein